MKTLFLLFGLILSSLTFAQRAPEDTAVVTENIAHFPDGGAQNFRQLLANNFRIKKVKGKGRVSCQLKFVVERDGSITDVTVTGSNESFNKEAVRAISLIKTKWDPARLNGVPVRYRFRVPLTIDFK